LSELITGLKEIQLLDYISVAATAAVCYDYILTFSREMDLIWLKPWTTMTMLFIATRYLGLAIAICSGLLSPGRSILSVSQLICTGTNEFAIWAGFVYGVTAKAIMILRVSAMFKRPRRMVYILSFMYLLFTIEAFVVVFLFEGPHSISGFSISAATVPIVDIAVCTAQGGRSMMLIIYGSIPGILFDLFLLSLALYAFAVHLRETREKLGKARVNVYMRLLFEHSILYFFFSFAYKGLGEGLMVSTPPPPMIYILLATLYCNTAPFILYPRLVLSFKGYRSQSDGLHVGSSTDGTRYSHSHSHSASSGAPSSGVYTLSDSNSPQDAPKEIC